MMGLETSGPRFFILLLHVFDAFMPPERQEFLSWARCDTRYWVCIFHIWNFPLELLH
jgi:hypothetical protein